MNCNEDWGCGKETEQLFSVGVKDWSHPDADPEDGILFVKVCSDCVASGDWEE